MLAKLGELGTRIAGLKEDIAGLPSADSLIDLQRVSADQLARSLETLLADDPVNAAEARAALGALISRIIMKPESKRGQYTLEIEGDLTAFLGLAGDKAITYSLVAGVDFNLRPSGW